MAETRTIPMDEVLVAPQRYSPRGAEIDGEGIARLREDRLGHLVDALAHGETLPPVVVGVPADADQSDWFYSQHWKLRDRNAWREEFERQPFASASLGARVVLLDGHYRYWAARRAGATSIEVQVDPEPLRSASDALSRAWNLNFRNPAALTDSDAAATFVRLWLGRPLKPTHEQFKPGAGAMPLGEIAARLRRSAAWCTAQQRYVRVTYALDGLDIGPSRAALVAKLGDQPATWRTFCLLADGRLRGLWLRDATGALTGQAKTILAITVSELGRVIDAHLRGLPMPDAAGDEASPETAPLGDQPADAGQYLLFGYDWTEQLAELRRAQTAVSQMEPQSAYDEAIRMAPLVGELNATYKALRERAAAGGLKF